MSIALIDSDALLERVAELSGLSPLLGPGITRRALRDAGAEATTARPEDFLRALPSLEARMRAYLTAEDVNHRLRLIRRALGASGSDSGPDKTKR